MAMGEVFMSRKSRKTDDNTVKSPKFSPTFIFSKVVQSAILESVLGHFWHPELMFDTFCMQQF